MASAAAVKAKPVFLIIELSLVLVGIIVEPWRLGWAIFGYSPIAVKWAGGQGYLNYYAYLGQC